MSFTSIDGFRVGVCLLILCFSSILYKNLLQDANNMAQTQYLPEPGLSESIYCDTSQLSAALSLINSTLDSIWKTWDISHYPYFLSYVHVPKQSWDIQKSKFIKLILRTGTRSFVVGFSGSSVTAGHDNYFREAYPQIFYEALAPIFRELRIELVVRNHALGNNPCYPYDACIETHLV